MTDPTRQDHWDAAFTRRSDDALTWYQATPTPSLRFIADSGMRGALLDVGGGTSSLVDHLLADGWTDLTVLDVSEVALARARQRLGDRAARVTWLRADITTVSLDRPFAVWHDRAVFHFLTEAADRQAYVARLRDHVIPGGAVVLATFAADGPTRCSGLDCVRYSPAALSAELREHFELVDSVVDPHPTPAGGTQDFQFCRFRRR